MSGPRWPIAHAAFGWHRRWDGALLSARRCSAVYGYRYAITRGDDGVWYYEPTTEVAS